MQIETKNYKDTVFKLLFNNKLYLLELYNAINGTSYTNPDDLEDTVTYRLSELFQRSVEDPSIELVVTCLNVNEGHNEDLMEACKALNSFVISSFVLAAISWTINSFEKSAKFIVILSFHER